MEEQLRSIDFEDQQERFLDADKQNKKHKYRRYTLAKKITKIS